MIHPLMKIGNISVPRKENITRAIYERAPYTVQVDTVKVGDVTTCKVKRLSIGDKIISAVIHMFDKDGKKIGKQRIK